MNQYKEQLRNLYSGILNNYTEFAEGEDASLTYDLEAREWEELRSRYTLENAVKTGTAFERAVRLTRYLAAGTDAFLVVRQPRRVQRALGIS